MVYSLRHSRIQIVVRADTSCVANLVIFVGVRSNIELLGGGKKRKKKTYTKPKKIKSKHKKVKLAVLKYYSVDQDGKVKRLRKECPAQCGAGTFMAMHFNRHYCGKCHLTYMLEKPGRDPALDRKKEAVVKEETGPAKGAAKGKKKK